VSEEKTLGNIQEGLDQYYSRFFPQFSLKLPRGKISKIDEYRDYYFPYLKDSVYKSNLCYLIQLLDYQILIYKTFRPGLSLANSFFYQQVITMGIISEAVCTALLLNPFIVTENKDRSLGSASAEYQAVSDFVVKNNFSDSIRLMKYLNIIDSELEDIFQKVRKDLRNLVHIQNWEDRIYQTMDYPFFEKHLASFKNFLMAIKEKARPDSHLKALMAVVAPDNPDKEYYGQVSEFFPEKGYGFVSAVHGPGKIFFHISFFQPPVSHVRKKDKVLLQIKKTEKGYEASRIQFLRERDSPHG